MDVESKPVERRRLPRVEVSDGVRPVCRLQLRTRIRLLDISLSGALLSSDAQLPVGTRGHLSAAVGAAPFSSDVQVKRLTDHGGRDTGLGTMFIEMDEVSRKSLERFLEKASEYPPI
jgi:hypothetical protein